MAYQDVERLSDLNINWKSHQDDHRAALEVGDDVIIWTRNRLGYTFVSAIVERKTKTQVALDNGERYYIRTGKRYGDGSSYRTVHYLIAPTDYTTQLINDYHQEAAERQAREEAEKQLRLARRDARDDRFWAIADAEVVSEIVSLMDAFKAKYDAKQEQLRAERGW